MYFRKTPSIPGLESDLDSDSDLAYAKHYGPLFFVGLDISLQCNGAEECTVGDEGIWGEFFFFFSDKMGNKERNILPMNVVMTVGSL